MTAVRIFRSGDKLGDTEDLLRSTGSDMEDLVRSDGLVWTMVTNSIWLAAFRF